MQPDFIGVPSKKAPVNVPVIGPVSAPGGISPSGNTAVRRNLIYALAPPLIAGRLAEIVASVKASAAGAALPSGLYIVALPHTISRATEEINVKFNWLGW